MVDAMAVRIGLISGFYLRKRCSFYQTRKYAQRVPSQHRGANGRSIRLRRHIDLFHKDVRYQLQPGGIARKSPAGIDVFDRTDRFFQGNAYLEQTVTDTLQHSPGEMLLAMDRPDAKKYAASRCVVE